MGKWQRQTACEENNNCKKCMGKAGHGFTELTISTCDHCLNTHTHPGGISWSTTYSCMHAQGGK